MLHHEPYVRTVLSAGSKQYQLRKIYVASISSAAYAPRTLFVRDNCVKTRVNQQVTRWDIHSATWASMTCSFYKACVDISQPRKWWVENETIDPVFHLSKTTKFDVRIYSTNYALRVPGITSSTLLQLHIDRRLSRTFKPPRRYKFMIMTTSLIKHWDIYSAIHALKIPLLIALKPLHNPGSRIFMLFHLYRYRASCLKMCI